MLVLSRKQNERIFIADEEIAITVIDIRGDKVRLGIEAAKDISIHRGEVWEAIKREKASGGSRAATGGTGERS
jgi:carbon storage regulator